MAKRKTAKPTTDGIDSLATNKPVKYEYQTASGKPIYIGSAKRGRVADRLKEHLPGGKDPVRGASKVKISQYDSIQQAKAAEERAIRRHQPTKNKRGK